jgi:hypothetical protein
MDTLFFPRASTQTLAWLSGRGPAYQGPRLRGLIFVGLDEEEEVQIPIVPDWLCDPVKVTKPLWARFLI